MTTWRLSLTESAPISMNLDRLIRVNYAYSESIAYLVITGNELSCVMLL